MSLRQPLLQAIVERPGDDRARAVYSDLLISEADPRGEFIALQLGVRTEASERRARTLQRKHLDAWLGPLTSCLVKTSVTFARGFPDEARVRVRTDEAVAAARKLDGWFSFTTLEFEARSFFVNTMLSLRHVSGVDGEGLRELLSVTPPLRRLGVRSDARRLASTLPAVLARLDSLEALRINEGQLDDTTVIALLRALPRSTTTLTLDQVRVTPEQGRRLEASAPLGLTRVVLSNATFTHGTDGWVGHGPAFV